MFFLVSKGYFVLVLTVCQSHDVLLTLLTICGSIYSGFKNKGSVKSPKPAVKRRVVVHRNRRNVCVDLRKSSTITSESIFILMRWMQHLSIKSSRPSVSSEHRREWPIQSRLVEGFSSSQPCGSWYTTFSN